MTGTYGVEVSGDSRFPVNRQRVRDGVMRVLKQFKVEGGVAVSVRIVGDRMMRKLNSQYRKVNETTDVLSFSTESNDGKGKGFVYPQGEPFPLGDVVISYPQAIAQAAERNVFVDDEVEKLLEHGVKSLLGLHE